MFNGIVKERFDKCQVGNIRLKSGLKSLLMGVNMILFKTKVETLCPRMRDYFLAFQSTLAGLKSLRKPTKQI